MQELGHDKNKWRAKQEINKLNLDEGLKKDLLQIPINSDEW